MIRELSQEFLLLGSDILGAQMVKGIAGEVPIWAAIHTPFASNGAIDEAGIRHNVRRYVELGLRGVFCNGLIGEVWALTTEERRQVLEIIIDEAASRLEVSVVVTGGSIAETLELGAHAKYVGANSVVLMVPTSGPRSTSQQIAYFEHVCPRLAMPVVVFNAATFAGSALPPAVFELICELPNLTLLKTTASVAENNKLREHARNGVAVSDPLEENFLANYRDHEQRVLFADPEPYLYQVGTARPIADYIRLLTSGQFADAQVSAGRLCEIRAVFNTWIMAPLRLGHMPCAAVKYWCDLIGMVGGFVRAPLTPLTNTERDELKADLSRCGTLGAVGC